MNHQTYQTKISKFVRGKKVEFIGSSWLGSSSPEELESATVAATNDRIILRAIVSSVRSSMTPTGAGYEISRSVSKTPWQLDVDSKDITDFRVVCGLSSDVRLGFEGATVYRFKAADEVTAHKSVGKETCTSGALMPEAVERGSVTFRMRRKRLESWLRHVFGGPGGPREPALQGLVRAKRDLWRTIAMSSLWIFFLFASILLPAESEQQMLAQISTAVLWWGSLFVWFATVTAIPRLNALERALTGHEYQKGNVAIILASLNSFCWVLFAVLAGVLRRIFIGP